MVGVVYLIALLGRLQIASADARDRVGMREGDEIEKLHEGGQSRAR
jgi:hypothetical protein